MSKIVINIAKFGSVRGLSGHVLFYYENSITSQSIGDMYLLYVENKTR